MHRVSSIHHITYDPNELVFYSIFIFEVDEIEKVFFRIVADSK